METGQVRRLDSRDVANGSLVMCRRRDGLGVFATNAGSALTDKRPNSRARMTTPAATEQGVRAH